MTPDDQQHSRLEELLAAAQLNDLSLEEQHELAELLSAVESDQSPELLGELLVMLDARHAQNEDMPAELRERLARSGRAAVASKHPTAPQTLKLSDGDNTKSPSPPLGWIASIAAIIAIGASIFAYTAISSKHQSDLQYKQQLASLQEQMQQNTELLERSRLAVANAADQFDSLSNKLTDTQTQLAAKSAENIDLAQRLADATTDLHDAQLRIAKYEEPTDPAILAERRQQLLDVPDTIQIAWQPFDLPDSPAEQQGVQGDVVWSDDLQQGYIRFVGLDANDPNIEQYQVWVIDERGLEQKVSGGVFNASADGEIIVPIEPGIDVGRVALFAVTVENPGGTWVPDLERRVVVAPRES